MSITRKSPDELREARLSENSAVCNVSNLPNILFSTDNGEIWVTISGEPRETTSGTFYLYDYDDGLAYIQQIFIDDVEREAAAFTGLDSRHRYRIVSEGIDGSVILIKVSEDIDKERVRH
jgi:hypothetical protein